MNRREFLTKNATFATLTAVATALPKIPAAVAAQTALSTRPYVNKQVSLLGFGCMRLPTRFGKIDMKETAELFDYAIRHGVNYFDTAWPYHSGKSETAVGEILKKYPRESFFLADKCPTWLIDSEDDVHRIFDEQLKKCQVDYFDFYLVHALDRNSWATAEKHRIFDLLSQKKKEGKIRALGFSFHDTPDVLEKILNARPWDFVQLQINYVDWTGQNAKRQYELVEQKKLPVIVMEPLRGGNLATLNEDARLVLKNADPSLSPAGWGLRYVASLPNVLTVLSGMNRMDHLKDNILALSNFKPMTPNERGTLEAAKRVYMTSGTIACTGCRYCKECPMGINIAGMFEAYNAGKTSRFFNKDAFAAAYKTATAGSAQANACIDCGLCEQRCPQHLPIRKHLKEISALAKG